MIRKLVAVRCPRDIDIPFRYGQGSSLVVVPRVNDGVWDRYAAWYPLVPGRDINSAQRLHEGVAALKGPGYDVHSERIRVDHWSSDDANVAIEIDVGSVCTSSAYLRVVHRRERAVEIRVIIATNRINRLGRPD